jgi:hypothetical protein
MKDLESPDVVLSYLPFSLSLLVLLSTAALGTLVVLGAWLQRTSKLLQNNKTDGTFDDALWVLTMARVAPECQGTARPARLCRGTLLMSILTCATKEYVKQGYRG